MEEPTEGEASEEDDGSREVWMRRFSTMKVGPPKGIKPAAHQNKKGEKQGGTGNESASPRRPVRTVGEEAKRHLERYHESTLQSVCLLADMSKYLHTLPTDIKKLRVWFRMNEGWQQVG